MKKILLSCVTCLLAVGLLAGCNEEDEVTPSEPETTIPSGDTSEDDESSSLPVTCKLGALDEENYTYRWFTGAASGNFLATSISWEKGIDVTISDAGSSDDGVTLSFVDEANATKYISWSGSTSVDITDEPYTWYWVEENSVFAAGSTEGRALVLYTNGSIRAYAQNDTNLAYPHVMAFSEKPTYPVAPDLPDAVTWEDGGTYLFGVNTIGAVRYIDGGVVDSSHTYEGSLTANLTYAVLVTIAAVAETNAYTLTFEVEGVTYYITTTTSGDYVNLAYSTGEAYLYWNETYGCWGNEEATHFLCYNSSYSCLYCSALEDYDGETPIASTYATVELPAPTELEISGPETVYLGHSAKYSVVVNEGADASVTWSVSSTKEATIDVYGNLTTGSGAEEVTITATSTATGATVTSATFTVSIEEEPTIVKLGALDKDYYTYRWLNGGTSSSHATTSMDWEGGVDVYFAPLSNDDIEGSCTLSFVNSSGELKYISIPNASNTNISFTDTPFTWIWDSENEVFKSTAESARYLRLYTNGTIRAYTSSTANDAYPAVKPYQTEPEAPIVPEDYPTLTAAESLSTGSTYYIGCYAYNGASYIFDGGNYNDQQLTASVQPTSFVAVTATGSGTDGWTFTFTLTEKGEGEQDQEVEYTLYSYMSGDYCEISAVKSSELESTLLTNSGTAKFDWDSAYKGITVTLDNTMYFLNQNTGNYAYEFRMSNYDSYASTSTWISFYPVTIEA